MEKIETVGIITYHHPHLKTEQVLQRILNKHYKYKIYALPFKERPKRKVLFPHRPNQEEAVAPQVIAEAHGIPYIICQSDRDIDNSCDLYILCGAGILSKECVKDKKIINCHPGIIPAVRGLDAFKWTIYDMKPLGITLHFIDEEVDSGEIIAAVATNVYKTDSLSTLARRHYENEIDVLARFDEYLSNRVNPFKDIPIGEPKRRMPFEKEKELTNKFYEYLDRYAKRPS